MNGEWGFCRYCIFEVPVEDGRMVDHERNVLVAGKKYPCAGSGQEPTPQPGPEAVPVVCVSLRKSYAHLAARKKRAEERAEYRAMQARLAALKEAKKDGTD